MNKFTPCTHGGGPDCIRQGGSGCTFHKAGYIHPLVHVDEVDSDVLSADLYKAVGDEKTVVAPGLNEEIQDDEQASDTLDSFNSSDDFSPKQLFYFDLQSKSGAIRLIELLPILDPDIVAEVYQTIWPGYPVDDEEHFNDRTARYEIKGYMLDYLEQNDLEDGAERPRQVPTSYDFRKEETVSPQT